MKSIIQQDVFSNLKNSPRFAKNTQFGVKCRITLRKRISKSTGISFIQGKSIHWKISRQQALLNIFSISWESWMRQTCLTVSNTISPLLRSWREPFQFTSSENGLMLRTTLLKTPHWFSATLQLPECPCSPTKITLRSWITRSTRLSSLRRRSTSIGGTSCKHMQMKTTILYYVNQINKFSGFIEIDNTIFLFGLDLECLYNAQNFVSMKK